MNPTYVGISGAAFRSGAISPEVESIGACGPLNWCCGAAYPQVTNCGALMSSGGILLLNESTSMTGVVDGSTYTIAVAEQSSADIRVVNPTTGAIDLLTDESQMRSSFGAGGWNGTSLMRPYLDGGCPADNDHFVYNITTVRYQINASGVSGRTSLVATGPGEGNKPITSAHPGIANVLFFDGGARSLAETTSLDVLMRLSDRADRGIFRDGEF